ncbi:hypothetical protein P22_0132 [Propionispora sp. 2/2-37]|uniref:DUF2953 domain-containing protein n=1 Tax=Propionispora sp. 2/2-37 TaxID=1677858 RepID=UPI0006BB677A|nr:DUF2953 domain-containing protein [Propionispora sp. 2/2-37]CUH94070.1 hypothetical protein P22_0132 [Propionispora sp. 2/2-37]
MEIWLIIVVETMMLLYVLWMSNVYISLTYKRVRNNDHLVVSVYSFKHIFSYTMEVPVIEWESNNRPELIKTKIETPDNADSVKTYSKREQRFVHRSIKKYFTSIPQLIAMWKDANNYLFKYKLFMSKLSRGLSCEQLSWHVRYGVYDAALTGMIYGIAWNVTECFLHYAVKRIRFMQKPSLRITPVFDRQILEIELHCIFRLKLGNVITAIWSIVYTKEKEARGSG